MKHVALLRGINVGGKNLVPMKVLAEAFVKAGCRDVVTYIQSGNVVFSASATVLKKLPGLISETFGVPVVIRSHEQLAAAIGKNPYLKEGADEKTLHLVFLADTPESEAIAKLDPDRSPPDRFHVVEREIYLHAPNGLGRSKLTNAWMDSKLSTVSTARNWATVKKLMEMSRG